MKQVGRDSATIRRISVSPLRQRLSDNGAKCGDDHFIENDFDLDKPAPCDGYIVQKVDIHQIIKDGADCPGNTLAAATITYSEAWWVAEGARFKSLEL